MGRLFSLTYPTASALLAIRNGHRYRFDIMDLVMPEMPKLETTEVIQKFHPDAKILMLTSTSRQEQIMSAKDLEVVTYLLKPVKIPQFMQAVHETLGRALTDDPIRVPRRDRLSLLNGRAKHPLRSLADELTV